MNIDVSIIEKVVRRVVEEVKSNEVTSEYNYGIFDSMEKAIEAACIAQNKYINCSMAEREKYVKTIREVILKKENLELISKLAVEETGMGNYEHKIIKNTLAAEKTPGTEDLITEAMSGDDGLTLIELSPFGVIGAITPTTNPTETIISNSIGMLAAGNSVVFGIHPRSKDVAIKTIRIINKALEEHGAPRNLITTVNESSIENTNIMMNHPKINMLVATGGPGIVKAVMSTGKKAIGAGAGNPPVVVDETANIEKAAHDIVNGCSFDNNLPCIVEKEVISVDQITDYLIFNMKKYGAYELKDESSIKQLEKLVLGKDGETNKDFVGKSAVYLLNKIGINVKNDIKVIIMETCKEHPFVQIELMMPILPIVRADNVDDAINIAIEAEHGNRHTAIMHSNSVDKLTKMAKLAQTTIFVKNGPSYAGIGVGGEGFTTFTIAGPTGEGLTSAKSFTRKRRCVLVGGFHIK